jgi:nucleotidyltransferase/DNA polymerase involved in DNA repair
VLHVDLDQFIAAVEVLRRPELRGLPVVVGGRGDPTERGVVSTASYEARVFGVHSGLPLRTAFKRCPDAVFLPVDREVYEAASAEVMAALRSVAAVVEVMGWDEAFLAISDESDPEEVAARIHEAVTAATRLDCSVGIGQNKLQAKMATGFGKPAGTFRLTDETWLSVLGDRPTDALWGIGAKTAKKLAAYGIGTVRELAAADPQVLAGHFGPTIGPWLARLGRGEDSSTVVGDPYVPRSRSRETTFQQNVEDWAQVRQAVAELTGRVLDDIAADGRDVVRVVVKVRYAPFFTATHGKAVAPPTLDADRIQHAALDALGLFEPDRPVRLVGVRAELTPPSRTRG